MTTNYTIDKNDTQILNGTCINRVLTLYDEEFL